MPDRRNTRLPGHSLYDEGKPYVRDPRPGHGLTRTRWTDGPVHIGMAVCECGATSPKLTSDGQRKRWHRDVHKPEVRRQQESGNG